MIDEMDWIGFGRTGVLAGCLAVVMSRDAQKTRWIALPNPFCFERRLFSWEESMVSRLGVYVNGGDSTCP
jgi:hypothetical protein